MNKMMNGNTAIPLAGYYRLDSPGDFGLKRDPLS